MAKKIMERQIKAATGFEPVSPEISTKVLSESDVLWYGD